MFIYSNIFSANTDFGGKGDICHDWIHFYWNDSHEDYGCYLCHFARDTHSCNLGILPAIPKI